MALWLLKRDFLVPRTCGCFKENEAIFSEAGAEFLKISLLERRSCKIMPLTKRSLRRPRARRGANRAPPELDAAEWITSVVNDPMVEIDPITMAQHLLDTESKGGGDAFPVYMNTASTTSGASPSTSAPFFVAMSRTPNMIGGFLLALGVGITLASFAAAFHPLQLEQVASDGNDSDSYDSSDEESDVVVRGGVDAELVVQSFVIRALQLVIDGAQEVSAKPKVDRDAAVAPEVEATAQEVVVKIMKLVVDYLKGVSPEKLETSGDGDGNQELVLKVATEFLLQAIAAAKLQTKQETVASYAADFLRLAVDSSTEGPEDEDTDDGPRPKDGGPRPKDDGDGPRPNEDGDGPRPEENGDGPRPDDGGNVKEAPVVRAEVAVSDLGQQDAVDTEVPKAADKTTDTVCDLNASGMKSENMDDIYVEDVTEDEKEDNLNETQRHEDQDDPKDYKILRNFDRGVKMPHTSHMHSSNLASLVTDQASFQMEVNDGINNDEVTGEDFKDEELIAEERKNQELLRVVKAAIPAIAIGAGAASALTGVENAFEMIGLAATAGFISFDLMWAESREQLLNDVTRITDHKRLIQFLKDRKIVQEDCILDAEPETS